MTTAVLTSEQGIVMTKAQLARHLGRSERWIELRVRDGMPSQPPTRRYACRRFVLAEVEDWLTDGPPRSPTVAERLAQLESEQARLRERIRELEEHR